MTSIIKKQITALIIAHIQGCQETILPFFDNKLFNLIRDCRDIGGGDLPRSSPVVSHRRVTVNKGNLSYPLSLWERRIDQVII